MASAWYVGRESEVYAVTVTRIDDMPAVVAGEWAYLLMPRVMHAVRVPAGSVGEAPWRGVLAGNSSLSERRVSRPPSAPWGVTLVTTHRCNLACVYCFSEVGHSEAALPLDRMLGLVDETLSRPPAGASVPFVVTFFGGEPTLNMADVRAVVEYVRERCDSDGVRYSFKMVTNGTAPAADMDFLVDHGFQLTISMDAAPERQQGQRIYGRRHSVQDTVGCIRRLAERGVDFRVRSTVTGETVAHMAETVAYFRELGVRFVHFEPVGPSGSATAGRLSRYSSPAAEDYAAGFIGAMDAGRELGVGVFGYSFQHILASPAPSYCEPMTGSGSYSVLNANGDLIMCPEMQDPARNKSYDHVIGRVTGRRTVEINLVRKSEIGALAAPAQAPSCQHCYARDICRSGCPSRNIQATGSLTKLDPYSCAVAKQVCADVLRRLAAETFAAAPSAPAVQVKPILLPPELATPPLAAQAIKVLKRVQLIATLTGAPPSTDLQNALDRLTPLVRTVTQNLTPMSRI